MAQLIDLRVGKKGGPRNDLQAGFQGADRIVAPVPLRVSRLIDPGFGQHSGALAAKEMGGNLRALSDGPGVGAAFILESPVTTASSARLPT